MQPGFDERAETWDDDPAKVERARQVAAIIAETVPLGPDVRLLEYGAGTGLVTEALRGAVGPVTLADTSAGMRAVMERKVAAGTLGGARIWDLDLSTAAPPSETFDLIVAVMTLDEGGRLCVVDLDEEDGSFHGGDFHGHRGFRRQEFATLLSDAGFEHVGFRACGRVDRGGADYPLFLAIAARGASDPVARL